MKLFDEHEEEPVKRASHDTDRCKQVLYVIFSSITFRTVKRHNFLFIGASDYSKRGI